MLLSPHTAALSPRENERIVELFLDNVHRLEHGRPIRNRITGTRPYWAADRPEARFDRGLTDRT